MTLRHFMAYSIDACGELIGSATTGSFYTEFEIQGQFYTGFSGSVDFENYSDSLVELQSAISTILSPDSVTLRYDFGTDRVILDATIATDFRFNEALQKVLGFDQIYASQTVITGSSQPWYIWIATNEYRSNDTEIYENEKIFEERIADSGRTYSVGNEKTANFRDWSYANEPKENVYIEQALTSVPFTYDLFLKNLRKGPYPFVIFDSLNVSSLDYDSREGTYEMRAEATKFEPKQKFDDFFDYWDLSLKTRLLSRPNQNLANNFSSLSTTGSFGGYNINGLYAWLNANKGGSFNSNMTLRQVTDQSPYGIVSRNNTSSVIHFSASNANWSNKSVYHLPGVETVSNTTNLSGSVVIGSTPTGVSICLIGEFIGNSVDANYRTAISLTDGSTSDIVFIGSEATSAIRKVAFAAYDFSPLSVNTMTSSQIPLNQKFIAVGTFNQSDYSMQLFVNGNDFATGVGVAGGALPSMSTNQTWKLTTDSVAAYNFPDMNVAEILAFDSPLTNQNINILLNYADLTYGITSSLLSV